jgi:hypothetical protein
MPPEQWRRPARAEKSLKTSISLPGWHLSLWIIGGLDGQHAALSDQRIGSITPEWVQSILK